LRRQPANVVAFVIDSLCAGDELLVAPTGGAAPSTAAGSTAAADVYADVATRQEAHPDAPLLFEAVGGGDLDRIEELLGSGVPVDSLNEDAATALVVAAEGEPSIVALLLSKGSNVDHQDKEGSTALIAAIKYEDPEIVEMLIAAGASRVLTDVGGLSAAEHAIQGGDSQVLDRLGLGLASDAAAAAASSSSSSEAMPYAGGAKQAGRRGSVSSESIDPKAKIDTSAIKVVPKDEATKARIKLTVGNNLLFRSLDREQLEAVVLSMEEVTVRRGAAIITQGDEGNHFYVVDRCRGQWVSNLVGDAKHHGHGRGRTLPPLCGRCAALHRVGGALSVIAAWS
jgi:hypothetical protein